MTLLAVPLVGLVLLGLGFGLRELRRGRVLGGTVSLGLGLVTAACLALALSFGAGLQAYRRLTHETPVLDVLVGPREGGPESAVYAVTLLTLRVGGLDDGVPSSGQTGQSGAARRFSVAGDAWQVEARVLKWREWATVLGLDARYRLERFRGRFDDLERARAGPRTVYGLLGPSDRGPAFSLDLWSYARRYPRWFPVVDTVFGSSVYMPLEEGAHYRVSMTQSGLVARPFNATAREAGRGWG